MAAEGRDTTRDDQPLDATPMGKDGAQFGTPRPRTGLDTGRDAPQRPGEMPVDPDFGMDPHVSNPGFGNTGRGSDTLTGMTQGRTLDLEGDPNGRGVAAGAGTSGQLHGGDTTSTDNTFGVPQHEGIGEAALTEAMGQGVEAPGAARTSANAAGPAVDENDESTFEEGMQHASGPRT